MNQTERWCDGWPEEGHGTNQPTHIIMHDLTQLKRAMRLDFCYDCLSHYAAEPCIGEDNRRTALATLEEAAERQGLSSFEDIPVTGE